MERRIYRVKNIPNNGFTIQETEDINYRTGKKTGKMVYNIWFDQFEGGEAYDTDWMMIDEGFFDDMNQVTTEIPFYGNWKSFDDAYNWLLENFGEMTLIRKETIDIEYYEED